MEEIRLGIDFGTTTTSVSVRVGETMPVALPIGADGAARYMPSVALFRPGFVDGKEGVVIGEEAEQNPSRAHVIHSVKRCMGCSGERCERPNERGLLWCRQDGRVHVDGVGVFTPEQVVRLILKEALKRAKRAARELGLSLDERQGLRIHANLGCSASAGYEQRSLLLGVAQEVGLGQLGPGNIVDEPILAGLAFARFNPEVEGRLLVYDFGGGTFDVSVLDVRRAGGTQDIVVLASGGEQWLGGDDIDALVRDHFLGQIGRATGLGPSEVLPELEPIDSWRLRMRCKSMKERLSAEEGVEGVLFTAKLGEQHLAITRLELEGLIEQGPAGLLQRMDDAVVRTCKLAFALDIAKETDLLDVQRVVGHTLDEAAKRIHGVVLVGGITSMPLIRRRVRSQFGDGAVLETGVVDPITAVSLGGAYERDTGHFSISHPPYGFKLRLSPGAGKDCEEKDLIRPFEHVRFFERWANVASCAYKSSPVELERDTTEAELGVVHAWAGTANWHSVGALPGGRWSLEVDIDGRFRLVGPGGVSKNESRLPDDYLHPAQVAVSQERQKRALAAGEKRKNEAHADAEKRKTIYGEN